MKHVVFYLIVIAFSGFIWQCSEETQLPTSAMESEETIARDEEAIDEAHFDADYMQDDHGETAFFEVTLENLTPETGPGSSQPFSPPVLATHKSGVQLFKVHRYASDELRQIAEDAVNGPLVDKLKDSKKVYQVMEGGGVIFPGTSDSFTIEAKRGYQRFSLVCMLVNTNDAFTGITRAKLPRHGEKVYYLYAYDAGTEKNTELTAHIPGPCCGSPLVRMPTHDKIRIHRGIMGNGDLDPAIYDWDKKVAKLTIRRIN